MQIQDRICIDPPELEVRQSEPSEKNLFLGMLSATSTPLYKKNLPHGLQLHRYCS